METYHKNRNKENNDIPLKDYNEFSKNNDNNNIINVSATTDVKLLIEYLINLFNSAKNSKSKLLNNDINDFNKYDDNSNNKNFNNLESNNIKVVLKGIKSAIDKVVLISEVVKSRVKGIHQILDIGCLNNEDIFYNDDYISKIIPKITVTLLNFEPKNKDLGYRPPYSLTDLYKLNTVVSKPILKSKIDYSQSIINHNFHKNKESIKKENVKDNNNVEVFIKDKKPYNNHKIIEFSNYQNPYKSFLKSIFLRMNNIKKWILLIESTSNFNINKEGVKMKNIYSDENNDFYFDNIIQKIRNIIIIINKSEFMIKEIFEISLCANLIKKVFFKFNNFENKFENLYLLMDKNELYINFNKINSLDSCKEEFTINELKFNETCLIINKIEVLFIRFLKTLERFHKLKSCLLYSINIKKYNRR